MDGLAFNVINAAIDFSDSPTEFNAERVQAFAGAYFAVHGRPQAVEPEPITNAEMHELLARLRGELEAKADTNGMALLKIIARLQAKIGELSAALRIRCQ